MEVAAAAAGTDPFLQVEEELRANNRGFEYGHENRRTIICCAMSSGSNRRILTKCICTLTNDAIGESRVAGTQFGVHCSVNVGCVGGDENASAVPGTDV